MRSILCLLLLPFAALGQSMTDNPQLASSRAFLEQIKDNVLKSADKMPEEKFSFKRPKVCGHTVSCLRTLRMRNLCCAASPKMASNRRRGLRSPHIQGRDCTGPP